MARVVVENPHPQNNSGHDLELLNLNRPTSADAYIHDLTAIKTALRSLESSVRSQGVDDAIEKLLIFRERLEKEHHDLNDIYSVLVNNVQGQSELQQALAESVEDRWKECKTILKSITSIQYLLDTDEHDHFALVIMRINEYESKKLSLRKSQHQIINKQHQEDDFQINAQLEDLDSQIVEISEMIEEQVDELKSFSV